MSLPLRFPGAIDYPTRGHPGHAWHSFPGKDHPMLVLHTRESGRMGGVYPWPPHMTYDPLGRWKPHHHVDFNRSAFALRGDANRRQDMWQVELVGRAKDTPGASHDWYDGVARLIGWFHNHLGVPVEFAHFVGSESYGTHGAVRMSESKWHTFTGVAGHQHAPHNTHWDPGALDTLLLTSMLGHPPQHHPDHTDEPEDTMVFSHFNIGHRYAEWEQITWLLFMLRGGKVNPNESSQQVKDHLPYKSDVRLVHEQDFELIAAIIGHSDRRLDVMKQNGLYRYGLEIAALQERAFRND